ncbi:Pro-neuregulin-3, membrane-bound-like protein [Gossypium arboreum]|uniref:Pro-neuregulin-3, membrane-bound-like protein n=1 Tax=Gossypium arboreum TaxID=29729 RepID=A0A0B0NTI7_GOSAR|nr:Pro-neuregulin-3, membrane-bound-like protein [Gossypium arboreum]
MIKGNQSDIHAMTYGLLRASVRPCLGHDIGIEMRASVRHVWDMHRPRDCRLNSSGIQQTSEATITLSSGALGRHTDVCLGRV